MKGTFLQNHKLIEVGVPKDYTGAACAAEWINLKNCEKVTWVIQTGAWAAGTAAVTLKQATSDGGSSAAVTFTKYWTVAGETVTENTATSNTINLAAASTMYVVEIDAPKITTNSNYDWVKIAIASPGANADFYSVTAIASNLKYGPSATLLA